MIFPGFPGVPSFFQVFQVFQVEWEPCISLYFIFIISTNISGIINTIYEKKTCTLYTTYLNKLKMFRSLTNICLLQVKWLKNRKNRRELLKKKGKIGVCWEKKEKIGTWCPEQIMSQFICLCATITKEFKAIITNGREGNVFRSVCQSFCPRGRGVGSIPPLGRPGGLDRRPL